MEVRCRFYESTDDSRGFAGLYLCDVDKISKASLEKEIVLSGGPHEDGKTNDDVKLLFLVDLPIGFVPRNLHRLFPSLTHLIIQKCGVEKLSREDLEGLEDIEYLSFTGNQLTSLPDDLFADMKKLRWIIIHDNRLERMSSKLLKPIERTLKYANFEKNERIDELFDKEEKGKNDLAKFMRTIDSVCFPAGSQAERAFEEFVKFGTSGEFSDFTLKIRGKDFKIHKMVFAAQSSVFRKIFTENDREKSFENYNEKTFEKFLDYFYTWKVDPADNAYEMFELASDFDVPELKIICTVEILKNLDESNALEVFNLAHLHASEELERKSFEVIKALNDGTLKNK